MDSIYILDEKQYETSRSTKHWDASCYMLLDLTLTDDDLLHLLSILPERAERNKDSAIDDLLPWSEKMKSWFAAV